MLTSDATGQGSWQPPPAASDLDCVGCVDTGDLADASVTGVKIANAAVGSSQIADGSLGTADLAFDPLRRRSSTRTRSPATTTGGTPRP